MLVTPALARLKHEDHEFQAFLGYINRSHLKNKTEKKRKQRKPDFLTAKLINREIFKQRLFMVKF